MLTFYKRTSTYHSGRAAKEAARALRANKGFTLIELLVVISIIGFLAAVVMSSLQTAREKTYDAQITSDMNQIKNALELYANDHGYMYPDPQVAALDGGDAIAERNPAETQSDPSFLEKFAELFSSKAAYAQTQSGRNRNCIRFDNLSSILVPNYIGSVPRHPLDDGMNVCYQYYRSVNGDTGGGGGGGGGGEITGSVTAIAYAPLVAKKYSAGNSKQVGVALGYTEPEALMEICAESLEDAGTPFPLFTGEDHCSGEIADEIIGITLGEGDVPLGESCSVPGYSSEEDCVADHSYCSDPQYTSEGQSICEANGSATEGYCEGDAQFTDESSCEEAEQLAVAGYCSQSGYSYEFECVNAIIVTSPASCSNGGYSDQYSCENSVCNDCICCSC